MLFQQGLKAATCPLYSKGETGLFQPFVVVKIKVLLTHLLPSRATFELHRFGNELSLLTLTLQNTATYAKLEKLFFPFLLSGSVPYQNLVGCY